MKKEDLTIKRYFARSIRWTSRITLLTMVLSIIFSILSAVFLTGSTVALGMTVVLFFILLGIASDTIGLATAAAVEPPFHAMAADKIAGAKEAVKVCRHAEVFSSFFNDVIGDIAGIVSGTATAVVVLQLTFLAGHSEDSFYYSFIAVVFTSIVAALTVGGKALCKSLAIRGSIKIILLLGKVIYFVENKLRIPIFKT